jgi:hypothetical protein
MSVAYQFSPKQRYKCTLANLSLSDAEMLGWDGFLSRVHAPFAPPTTQWSNAEAKFNFQRVLLSVVMKNEYDVYDNYYTVVPRINMMQQTIDSGDLYTDAIFSTISWTLFETYVANYRSKVMDSIKKGTFSMDQVPWKTLPNVTDVLQWYYTYLDILYARQCVDLNKTQTDNSQYPTTFNLYGTMQFNAASPLSTRDPMWSAINFALMHVHYTHLMDKDRLLLGRTRIMACYTALRIAINTFMPDENGIQTSVSQYLNTVVGSVLCASFLVQSNKYLTQMNVPIPPLAGSDWTQGQWTEAEAVSYAEYMCMNTFKMVVQVGAMEYCAAYVHYQLMVLTHGLMYACSAKSYYALEKTYQFIWTDCMANYQAAAGSLTSALSRCYNLYDNQHQLFDSYYLPLYVNSLLRPNKQDVKGKVVTDATIPIVKYTDQTAPATNFHRNDLAMRQLGGYGWLPEQVIQQIQYKMPSRVWVTKHGKCRSQYRYTHHTPDYAMGHAGLSNYDLAIRVQVVARFSPSLTGPTSTVTNPIFRTMLEATDGPFVGDVPGNNVQSFDRLLCVQSKNIMLLTSMAYTDDASTCLNSNVFVPLNVDSIVWINGTTSTNLSFGASPAIIQSSLSAGSDNMLVVKRDSKTFVGRLLLFESDISAASAVSNAPYAIGSGQQPYALMWQVAADERNNGVGRLIVHHRHSKSGGVNKAYKTIWLWSMWSNAQNVNASGALSLMKTAAINVAAPTYQNWDLKTPLGSVTWGVSATVYSCTGVKGSETTLSLQRTDTFQPDGNDRICYDALDEGANVPPISTRYTAIANGVEVSKIYPQQANMMVTSV